MKSRNLISLILALLLFAGLNSHAGDQKVMIFSDVDDTIKISFIRSKVGMANFSTFADSLFYGMDQVYRAISDSSPGLASFHYVSNGWAPTVKGTHRQLLKQFNFPEPENYHSRVLKTIVMSLPHKTKVILEKIALEKPSLVVLIGDNGEFDHKYYHDIEQTLGKDTKVRSYIHLVDQPKNAPNFGLYPGQQGFTDAADLAMKLFADGILTREKAKEIVTDVVHKINNEPKGSVYGPLVYPFYKMRPAYENANHYMCRAFYTL